MSLKLYFKIFIFLNFLFQFSLATQNEEEGLEEEAEEDYEMMAIEPRIAGGYRPNKTILAKYVVSLRLHAESDKHFGYTHFCAGSIIAANKILTAAHCLFRQGKPIKASTFKVVAKAPLRLQRTSTTQEIQIKEIIIHPNYSEKTMFHDIALLLLKEDILLDAKMAAPISLPKEDIQAGRLCTIIGWGKLYMNGPLANEILFVDLFLHSRINCRKKYPNISGKKICASDLTDREKDACLGDSGGPLICNGILTGIVSYGYGCASGHDGIYTNVFKYIDWISNGGNSLINPFSVIILNICLTFFL